MEHMITSRPPGWKPDALYDGRGYQKMVFPKIVNGIYGKYKVNNYFELNLVVRGLGDGTDVSNFLIH